MNRTNVWVGGGVLVAGVLCFFVGMLTMGGISLGMKITDEAAFCASCHVMSEAAWTHSKSVHAKQACNECHVPSNILSKIPFKVASGTHDIYSNFFTRIADVIHTTDNMKQVIQENCRRCHTMTTSTVAMDAKQYCTDCHRAVPHNKRTPVSTRRAGDV